jgi:hypothetical protein
MTDTSGKYLHRYMYPRLSIAPGQYVLYRLTKFFCNDRDQWVTRNLTTLQKCERRRLKFILQQYEPNPARNSKHSDHT